MASFGSRVIPSECGTVNLDAMRAIPDPRADRESAWRFVEDGFAESSDPVDLQENVIE